MRMRGWFVGAVAAAALPWSAALAHEGGTHVRGVVKEVGAERLVLTTSEGETVEIALAPATRVTRGQHAVPREDVHPGDRAVVHAQRGAGGLEATEVRLGDAAKR